MTKICKIQRIRSIGNYDDYIASGDVMLKKFNFIYAENGVGKTTLSSILRSLSNGDSTIIKKHKRLHSLSDPLVEIRFDDNHLCSFDRGCWNHKQPDIEVFDSYFVVDNVYSGMDITLDNRRALYKFVLGDAGVTISCKITKTKQLINIVSEEANDLSQNIWKSSGGRSADEIVRLKPLTDVDIQIKTKNQELKIARDNDVIRTHDGFPLIPSIDLPFQLGEIKDVLERSLNTISDKYLDDVSQRIKKLSQGGMNNAESWIHEGFITLNIQDVDACPFCGQSLDNVKDIITGYKQYFNESYNQLIKDIAKIKYQFDLFNATNKIKEIKDTYDTLVKQYKFWHIYLNQIPEPPRFLEELNQLIVKSEKIRILIADKQNKPLTKFPSPELQDFSDIIDKVIEYIDEIQKYVLNAQQQVDNLKQSVKEVKRVENELQELNLIKVRYQSPLKDICDRYLILMHRLNCLKHINTDLQHKQKQNSQSFLSDYGSKINKYLSQVFCTDFQIANVCDGGFKGRGKEAAIDYDLTFKGQSLTLNTDDNLSVKNTLSEGDKNTIALCLFLAKLDNYPPDELSQKIIIFDDPLTSLDMNRRNATIAQLVRLADRCAQIIVLSHNLAFLLELFNSKDIRRADKKVLCIEKSGDDSILEEYELKDKLSSSFAQYVANMENFLKKPYEKYKETAIASIRLSLEAYLKFKYGRYLGSLDQTFGQVIHDLEQNTLCKFGGNKKEVVGKLKELNSISWRSHHAPIDEAEYKEVNITDNELYKKYIPMTLELLFGK